MSRDRNIKLPPLRRSQKQRPSSDHTVRNDSVQTSDEGQCSVSFQVWLHWTGSSYMYACPARKPQLLIQLESYMNTELQAISPREPQFQELKLQVYRNAFGCLISAFRTYQPLLSDIKKEYENTLVHQQNLIQDLEPLRSHLKLMGEECDRKIQARFREECAVIETLKRENQQLKNDIEAMREKEKSMQTVVDHLQSELSNQYLQLREEHDARKLLIWQLNDLTRGSRMREHSADKYTSREDSKRFCQEDLSKAQEELKAEHWDVVPRCNWDTLEQSQLQLKTLQGDFDHLKSEYDILLELHQRDTIHTNTHVSNSVQTGEEVFEDQSQIHSNQSEESNNEDDITESSTVIMKEFWFPREAHMTAKSDEETDKHMTVAQTEADSSNHVIFSETPP